MHSTFYLEQIKQFQAPSTEDLEKFIRILNAINWKQYLI